MKIKIIFFLAIVFFISSSVFAEERITLTTYYPSPFGAYDRLQLVPRPQITKAPCDLGLMYFRETDNLLQVCEADRNGNPVWGPVGLWTKSGDNIYPKDGTDINVGIGTATPEAKLNVKGDVRIQGRCGIFTDITHNAVLSVGEAALLDDTWGHPIPGTGMSAAFSGNVGIKTPATNYEALKINAIQSQVRIDGDGANPDVDVLHVESSSVGTISINAKTKGGTGIDGFSFEGYGVKGRTNAGVGVFGQSQGSGGGNDSIGVKGEGLDWGGYFESSGGKGIYAKGTTIAGEFQGNVEINGNLDVKMKSGVGGDVTVDGVLNLDNGGVSVNVMDLLIDLENRIKALESNLSSLQSDFSSHTNSTSRHGGTVPPP